MEYVSKRFNKQFLCNKQPKYSEIFGKFQLKVLAGMLFIWISTGFLLLFNFFAVFTQCGSSAHCGHLPYVINIQLEVYLVYVYLVWQQCAVWPASLGYKYTTRGRHYGDKNFLISVVVVVAFKNKVRTLQNTMVIHGL